MINIDFDNNKVIISDDMLIKLKYLIKKVKKFYYVSNEDINNELYITTFEDIMEKMVNNVENKLDYLPDKDNEINYNTDYLYELVSKYKQLNSSFIFNLHYYHGRSKANSELYNIPQMITYLYEIEKEINKYYLLRDLICAKEDIIKDMRYFLDDSAIDKFNSEYEEAIQKQDTDKMKTMLLHIQTLILKEWENLSNDIDSMTDENFCFIGHSTGSTKFKGNFYSKYVSASLFTQDLTSTYRSGYGFIFAPKNIVGASSSDMYVDNYTDDEDSLLNYSLIKKISHPQRVIDECLKTKEKGGYSEVIIDGFEPIGIFCFTNGTKKFDYNYKCVKVLQESFPNLKVYEFDTMKTKTGDDLIEIQLVIINKLKESLTSFNYEITKKNLYQYQMFFDNFDKLKEKGNYTEEDIKDIFNENIRMLSILDKEPDTLFSGIYTVEQIKYILSKNINYNIELILQGEFNAYMINKLKVLYPYRNKLDDYFEGLSEFIELINKVSITDEILKGISNIDSLNFYVLSKYIIEEVIKNNINRIESLSDEKDSLKDEYDKLLKELKKKQEKEEQYNYYNEIYHNRFWENIIKDDYDRTIRGYNISLENERQFNSQLSNIRNKIKFINNRIQMIDSLDYKETLKYQQIEQELMKLYSDLETLKKHPFINRKKIKEIKNKIKKLANEHIINNDNFVNNKSKSINKLETELLFLKGKIPGIEISLKHNQENKNKFEKELINIKNKIKEYFKCDSIAEIDVMLEKAKIVVDEYDYMNKYNIEELTEQIKRLYDIIIEHERDISVIQQENDNISKVI